MRTTTSAADFLVFLLLQAKFLIQVDILHPGYGLNAPGIGQYKFPILFLILFADTQFLTYKNNLLPAHNLFPDKTFLLTNNKYWNKLQQKFCQNLNNPQTLILSPIPALGL